MKKVGKVRPGDFIDRLRVTAEENNRRFQESGGMCINCGQAPADPSGVNSYHCEQCNIQTEETLDRLAASGGTGTLFRIGFKDE